jgi:hypothetical protein
MVPAYSGAMTGNEGHLFVVLGRLESLVHDVAIVPTSGAFGIRDYWRTLTGDDVQRHRPAGLASDGHGPSPVEESLWFIDVGAPPKHRLEVIGRRLSAAVAGIVARGVEPGKNRARALIAVPIIGVAGGGLDRQRGHAIERQIEVCRRLVAEHDVDIAIVTPDRASYGAAQYLRTRERQPIQWDLEPLLIEESRRLGDLARKSQLALFLGAGVSIPAGLPTWDQLLDELSKGRLKGAESGLSALDLAQLIELRSRPGELGKQVARIVGRADRPSLAHALLAGLGAKEVVTTNYDRLYEKAVATVDDQPAAVLPEQLPMPERPWILKLHGDIRKPDGIVLTRRHFVRFDAQTRPAGALLQSLLMTRHLLVVGVSLNDDNVVRLAHEVEDYREAHQLSGTFGTLLDLDGDPLRRELWRKQLRWLSLEGVDVAARARLLEIFLDAVAAHASSNQAWLLDRRFEDLLTPNGKKRAKHARELYSILRQESQTWQPLREALEELGVRSGDGA